MSISYINNLKKIGLCIKSKDLKVEYQNTACESICGDQKGNICNKGCILRMKNDQIDFSEQAGVKLLRNLNVDDQKFESVIISDGEKIITTLLNSEEIIENQLDQLKAYKLSLTEKKIMNLFLRGRSNLEIATELFISKSTIRTHLNNIYKKIPEALKKNILKWHFSK